MTVPSVKYQFCLSYLLPQSNFVVSYPQTHCLKTVKCLFLLTMLWIGWVAPLILTVLISLEWAVGLFGGSADLDWILSNLWSWLIVGHSSPCASHIPPMCQPILMAKPRSKGKTKNKKHNHLRLLESQAWK